MPSLLSTALAVAPADDVELSWAFLVFCGVVDSAARDQLAAAFRLEPLARASALKQVSTPRGQLLDEHGRLAAVLWRSFEWGRTVRPDQVDDAEQTVFSWRPRRQPCVEITD